MDRCEQEMCPNWDDFGCPCAVLDTVPHATPCCDRHADRGLYHWHGHGHCVVAAPGRSIHVDGWWGCRGADDRGEAGTPAGVRKLAAALLRAAEVAEQPAPDEETLSDPH